MYALKSLKNKKFVRYYSSTPPITKTKIALWVYTGAILGGGLIGAGCGLKKALDDESELKNDPYNIASSVAIGSMMGLCFGICSPILILLSPFLTGLVTITVTKTETQTGTIIKTITKTE